jgi:integrator complex subunit 9
MLDCALDMSSVLNFMPIPLVQSAKLAQLPKYLPKDGDHNFDGVSSFLKAIYQKFLKCLRITIVSY